MPNVVENNCPTCYQRLPPPKHFLQPCDNELNYFMWMPGFEWKPEEEYDETSSEGSSESSDRSSAQEALEDVVEVDELKQKFNDEASNGYIQTEQAGRIARSIGLAPSFADVDKAISNGSTMNYTQFQQFCSDCTHSEDKVDDLVQVFRYYDKSNSGKLSQKQIAFILSTWGEPLSSSEVDAMLKDIIGVEDPVDYIKFVETLLARDNMPTRVDRSSERSSVSSESNASDATSQNESDSDSESASGSATSTSQNDSYQNGSDSSSEGDDDSGGDSSSSSSDAESE